MRLRGAIFVLGVSGFACGTLLDLDGNPTADDAAGVSMHLTWVYFVTRTGSVHRVRADGTGLASVYTPTSPATGTVGDLTITPSGTHAFWAEGHRIMGLALPL